MMNSSAWKNLMAFEVKQCPETQDRFNVDGNQAEKKGSINKIFSNIN